MTWCLDQSPASHLHVYCCCPAFHLRTILLLCRCHLCRCEKVLYGHQHSFEQNLLRCDWSPDGNRVAAGSADRIVYIWDAGEGRLAGCSLVPAFCFLCCALLLWGEVSSASSAQTRTKETVPSMINPAMCCHLAEVVCCLPAHVSPVLCAVLCCAATCEVQYALPGHKGSVNEVVFHPKEPIVGSCSNDRTIFLGELADS
jgi:WD40 repeat protein